MTVSESIDIMAEPVELFNIVGDLASRGHYWPEGAMAIRELAPRPFSPTEKFLPGQRISFIRDGKTYEHEISEAVEWDQAEAHITEKVLRSPKNETVQWRLSELTSGTIRVSATASGDFGALEKLTKAPALRKYYAETLTRLKSYVEDKHSYAGPRTFAPKPSQQDLI